MVVTLPTEVSWWGEEGDSVGIMIASEMTESWWWLCRQKSRGEEKKVTVWGSW